MKEMERVSSLVGETITPELLQRTSEEALAKLIKDGVPKERLQRILTSARPLGDFHWFEERMSYDDFQKFFGGPVRKWGLDGSIPYKYGAFGASSVGTILNVVPEKSYIDVYEEMRGKKRPISPDVEDIFFAGHKMEPVLRDYFEHMFGNRYIVITCDIQWHWRKTNPDGSVSHFIGNVDGLLIDKDTGQFGILEIKHTIANNVKLIKAFQAGDTPKGYELQQRSYMELLDADFSCIFLGWGTRPGLDSNAMNRIERDQDFGESILEQVEDFMVGNVEAGVRPSFKGLNNYERVTEAMENLYGPVNPNKKPIMFPKAYEKNLEKLVKAQEAIEKAKEAEKEAKAKVEELTKEYERLQLPILDELGNAPKGYYVSDDGTHYDIGYNVPNGLNVEKVKDLYPDEYEKHCKASVDTKSLKRDCPDVYRECFGPKVNGKRKFTLNTWRSKR